MKRREFLKIFGLSFIGIFFVKSFLFAKSYTKKCIEAVRNGRYPGKIKQINNGEIIKKGKWSG